MWQRPVYIRLSCTGEQLDEAKLPKGSFIDICEDIYGRDKLTFKCPACGQEHSSLRFT